MLILNNVETLASSCQDPLCPEERNQETNKAKWLEDKASKVETVEDSEAVTEAASEAATEADLEVASEVEIEVASEVEIEEASEVAAEAASEEVIELIIKALS